MAKKAINQEVLDQWEYAHKQEVNAVKFLGETIGYGNMMSIASALWCMHLKESNMPITGAFIPTVKDCMKIKEGKRAVEEQERRADSFKKMLKK